MIIIKKNISFQPNLRYLFQYGVERSGERMYHLAASHTGDCLAVSSTSGSLLSSGVDCTEARRPLCHRLGRSFSLARLERQINTCAGGGEHFQFGFYLKSIPVPVIKCTKWLDLATVESSLSVSGLELCVSPCNTVVWFLANSECQVSQHSTSLSQLTDCV